MNVQGNRIAEIARSCLGKPYRHRAYGPNSFDCLGLLIFIAKEMDYQVPYVPAYSKNPSGLAMKGHFEKHAIPIHIGAVRPGDFLHMAWGNQPQHVAIVTKETPLTVCHADSQLCMVVEHVLTVQWRGKIRGAYRFPQIEDSTAEATSECCDSRAASILSSSWVETAATKRHADTLDFSPAAYQTCHKWRS